MSSTFFSDFLANLFADLAVFLLGVVSALLIGMRLNIFERREERRAKEFADMKKAHTYLFMLKGEIQDLVTALPLLRSEFTKYKWGREIAIDTKYWDILERSGELPKVLSPVVLFRLTEFYWHLQYAQRGLERLLDSWLVPQPHTVPGMEAKQRAFCDMTVHGLEQAIQLGPNLEEKVDSELEALHEEIKELASQSARRPWWQGKLGR